MDGREFGIPINILSISPFLSCFCDKRHSIVKLKIDNKSEKYDIDEHQCSKQCAQG